MFSSTDKHATTRWFINTFSWSSIKTTLNPHQKKWYRSEKGNLNVVCELLTHLLIPNILQRNRSDNVLLYLRRFRINLSTFDITQLNYGLSVHCYLYNRSYCSIMFISDEPQFVFIVKQTRAVKVVKRMLGLDQTANKKVEN